MTQEKTIKQRPYIKQGHEDEWNRLRREMDYILKQIRMYCPTAHMYKYPELDGIPPLETDGDYLNYRGDW